MAIPRPVTNAIDKLAHAVLISKGEQVLHANPKALEIFGYGSVDDLINDDAVWTYFSTLGQSVPVATLTLENGGTSASRRNCPRLPGTAALPASSF